MAFPIKCGDCKKSFSISDDVYNRKVRGKLVTIKCKSCGAGIRVDGTKPAATSKPPPAPSTSVGEKGAHETAPVEDAGASKAAKPAGAAANAAAPSVEKPVPAAAKQPPFATGSERERPARELISSPTKPAATRPLQPERTAKLPETAARQGLAARARIGGNGSTGSAARASSNTGATPTPAAAKPLPFEKKSDPLAARRGEYSPRPARVAPGGQTPKPAAARAPTAPTPDEPSPAAARPAAARASGGAEDDAILWAVDYGESEHRELTSSEIEQELKKGTIDEQTLVWHDNMPDWLAIRDVKELRRFVEEAPNAKQPTPRSSDKGLPSVPKAAPLPPLGPLSSRPPVAPSPPKPATSRPPPPPPKKSRPLPIDEIDQDEVVTSARLIDAAEKRAPSDPFSGLQSPALTPGTSPLGQAGVGAGAGLAAMPTAAPAQSPQGGAFPNPLGALGLPASASPAQPALGASAPAQPVPLATPTAAAPPAFAGQPAQPAFAPAAGLPGTALPAAAPAGSLAGPGIPAMAPATGLTDDLEWPQARSKKPLILGAVGVLAVVVVAWLLLGGESEEPTVPPPVSTQTQAATPTETPAAPPPAAPAPQPTSPEPAAADEPSPSQPAAPASDSGDFADLFKKSAQGNK